MGSCALAGLASVSVLAAAPPSGKPSKSAAYESYAATNVLNFIIDGPKLAREGARVDVYGTYIREGSVDVLYEDTTAVARARTWPQPPPHVVVITEDATRALRAKLVSCQVDAMQSQLGCRIAIRGRVVICEVTAANGVPRREPCLEAQDETPPAIQVDP